MDQKIITKFGVEGTPEASSRIKAFSSNVDGAFTRIKNRIQYATQSIGVFGTAITALSSGIILKKLFSIKDFMPIDKGLLMMQANLRQTAKELMSFKSDLSAMAGKEGEDITELFNMASKLSVTYKPDDILQIMKASAMVTDAMDVDLTGAVERITQIMKIYRKTPDEAKAIAESLTASRLDLESLDLILQRGILQGGSSKDYKDVLGFFAGLKKAGLDSPRVLMRFEGALSSLFEKSKQLKHLGIDAYTIDPQTKEKVKKDAITILEELDKTFKTKYKNLQKDRIVAGLDKMFGEGAGEGIFFMISQLDKLKKAQQDQNNAAGIAAERIKKVNESWEEQLKMIKGHLDGIKDDFSIIYDTAKKLPKYLADSPKLTKGLGYGAAGLSALVLSGLGFFKGKEFFTRLFKGAGGTALGLATGKAIESATGVQPVFVTNFPASFGNDVTNTVTAAGGVSLMGRFVPYIAPIVAGTLYAMKAHELDTARSAVGEEISKLTDRHSNLKSQSGPLIQNQIPITINIDPTTGRSYADTPNMNTVVSVNRGNMFKKSEWSH